MGLTMVQTRELGHNRLTAYAKRGRVLQNDKVFRLAILIASLRDSSPNDHKNRLSYAKKIRDLADEFIAEEVTRANSKSKDDSHYMSWGQIGQVLGKSRSATFTKYGSKR